MCWTGSSGRSGSRFPADYFLPVNIGEALFPGAEADLTLQLLPGLRLTRSYTFLYSFVLKGASATYSFADDKRAIYSPVHKADLAAELSERSHSPRSDRPSTWGSASPTRPTPSCWTRTSC